MTEANQTNETDSQRYKTAEELKITQEQFCALIKVREALADGTLVWVGDDQVQARKLSGANVFNMSRWHEQHTCGTVGCIGGWSGFFAGERNHGDLWQGAKELRYGSGIKELFFPFGGSNGSNGPAWSTLKPQHAVRAIDNFLKTGNPNWKEAISKT